MPVRPVLQRPENRIKVLYCLSSNFLLVCIKFIDVIRESSPEKNPFEVTLIYDTLTLITAVERRRRKNKIGLDQDRRGWKSSYVLGTSTIYAMSKGKGPTLHDFSNRCNVSDFRRVADVMRPLKYYIFDYIGVPETAAHFVMPRP